MKKIKAFIDTESTYVWGDDVCIDITLPAVPRKEEWVTISCEHVLELNEKAAAEPEKYKEWLFQNEFCSSDEPFLVTDIHYREGDEVIRIVLGGYC